MKVGLAAYLLHGGESYRAAGVSTYVRELVAHLPPVGEGTEFVAYVGPDAPRVDGVVERVSPAPTFRAPVRIAWEQLVLPVESMMDGIDVVHGTVNVVPLGASAPSVVTVHDLSFMRLPDRFSRVKVGYLRAMVALSVRRARRVIAVSENTRRDLMELLRLPPEKIRVIYSGVHGRFRPLPPQETAAFRERMIGGRPYILHVGTLEPRKNLDVLVRAYAAIRAETDLPHALVLVGARGWMYAPLFRLVRDLGLERDVTFADYAAPQELPHWYNAADLFAYPSAYEGFGLPVLEAMACGTPIITTTGSALGEVAGSAGLTVEPGSAGSLEAAIRRVLEDTTLRNEMRMAGLDRAAGFSWARTAQQTMDVYREVAG